jgi:type VI secretion system protein ImpA
LLEEILGAVRHFAADKLAAAAYETPSDNVMDEQEGDEGEDGSDGGKIQVRRMEGYATREEALAELLRIGVFFRKTEPHSPISYTLEEAVRRARMSLPDLLAELAEDPAHIQRILLAAGIKPPAMQSEY